MTQQERKKTIEVFSPNGEHLSYCTKKRAAQMVHRKKAKWIGIDQLRLVVDEHKEKEIRERVIIRDNGTCRYCGDQLTNENLTIDHLIPRSRGGTDFENNLAVACHFCNEMKDDLTEEEFEIAVWNYLLFIKTWYK